MRFVFLLLFVVGCATVSVVPPQKSQAQLEYEQCLARCERAQNPVPGMMLSVRCTCQPPAQ